MNLSATFAALFSISAAAAQTTTPDDRSMLIIQSLGLKDELPKPGYNMEGGSVFDNYVKAQSDGQFFIVGDGILQYEAPSSELVEGRLLRWCSDIHITGNNGTYTRGVGYTAHCVSAFIGDIAKQAETAGAELPNALTADEFSATYSLSATYNAHTNMFNLAIHQTGDNNIWMHSDTGIPTMPAIGWEVNDEGDLHPNADSSSWSGAGQVTWVSKEEAALLLNNNATEYTPETFVEIYEKVWNDEHNAVAAAQQTASDVVSNEKEEESTDADVDMDESGGNDEDSVATEDTEEEDDEEEGDESSASNGRRLFVAITSMLSTLLGSSV